MSQPDDYYTGNKNQLQQGQTAWTESLSRYIQKKTSDVCWGALMQFLDSLRIIRCCPGMARHAPTKLPSPAGEGQGVR